jgi:hypothetical protein
LIDSIARIERLTAEQAVRVANKFASVSDSPVTVRNVPRTAARTSVRHRPKMSREAYAQMMSELVNMPMGPSFGFGGMPGFTATGIPLHVGPNGGVYHFSSGGNKEYHPDLRR